MEKLLIKSTCYPKNRPDFNTWCKEMRVSVMYEDGSGRGNAHRIMSLWDGVHKFKQIFIKKISTNED